ncbi:MAG TPA: hypothetical protein VM328_07260 [Fimbriimonadaceae bacterium]|nr:hypothetical protein [Fimbriimonadaceae bacterium]
MFSPFLVLCAVVSAPTSTDVVAQSPPAAGAASLNIIRSYKEGELTRYEITAELVLEGSNGSARALLESKVVKAHPDGTADVSITPKEFSMVVDGSEMVDGLPEPFEAKFDRHGLPDVVEVRDHRFAYALLVISSYAPGPTQLKKEFGIVWKAKDGNSTISGKGAVVEVTKEQGMALVVLQSSCEVSPSEDTPGRLKCKAWIELESGKLVRCEGTVEVGDGAVIKYKIKRMP